MPFVSINQIFKQVAEKHFPNDKNVSELVDIVIDIFTNLPLPSPKSMEDHHPGYKEKIQQWEALQQAHDGNGPLLIGDIFGKDLLKMLFSRIRGAVLVRARKESHLFGVDVKDAIDPYFKSLKNELENENSEICGKNVKSSHLIVQSSFDSDRVNGALLGAFVGDAACLGLHWVYDDDALKAAKKLFNGNLTFLNPKETKKIYDMGPSYYAHATKKSGDLTHVGELVLVGLDSIANDELDVASFKQRFRNVFSYGGSFHGYIDSATRKALNILEDEVGFVLNQAPLPNGIDYKIKEQLIAKIKLLFKKYKDEEFISKANETIKEEFENENVLEFAKQLIDIASTVDNAAHGGDDTETHSLSLLIPAVAVVGSVERSLQFLHITADNDETDNWNTIAGEALLVLFKGGSIEEAFKQAQSVSASEDSTTRLQTVLDNIDQDHVAFVAENGKACALKQCIPGAFHVVLQTLRNADEEQSPSTLYKKAISLCVAAGGNSPGRAILIGALFGAHFGVSAVPPDWLVKVDKAQEIFQLLAKL